MRFDVYKMPPGGAPGYVVDVQSDLLSGLPSRLVVPLLFTPNLPKLFSELNPEFEVLGAPCILMTQELASIQSRHLECAVASLAPHRDEITRAIDLLLTGF